MKKEYKDEDISLDALLQGDTQSMSLFYEHYVDRIYQYFFYRTSNKLSSQDLTSETFFAFFESLSRFDPTTNTSLKTRLYSIAHNLLRQYFTQYQKEAWRTLSLDDTVIGYDENILEQCSFSHQVEQFFSVLEELHPHAKQIVLMKIWEGMSHAQIAQELWISIDNTKQIYSRSLKTLKERFGGFIVSFIFLSLSVCHQIP